MQAVNHFLFIGAPRRMVEKDKPSGIKFGRLPKIWLSRKIFCGLKTRRKFVKIPSKVSLLEHSLEK
jgi:hypothetical protein